jgi:hypothetical protein
MILEEGSFSAKLIIHHKKFLATDFDSTSLIAILTSTPMIAILTSLCSWEQFYISPVNLQIFKNQLGLVSLKNF